MVDNFIVLEVAKKELHQAICYFKLYDRSTDFLKDFESQIEIIKNMPYGFQVRYKQVRIISFNHFQYTIHYKIEDTTVYILHVLNQSQSY